LCPPCISDDRESTPITEDAPSPRTSYVYVSGLKEDDPEECVLMYDRLAKHGDKQHQVVLLDTNVRLLTTSELEAALARTREWVKKRNGAIRLLYGVTDLSEGIEQPDQSTP